MTDPIIVTSKSGPNMMPVGTHEGRPVAFTYALGVPGSWFYTDPPRDYLPADVPVDWSAVNR